MPSLSSGLLTSGGVEGMGFFRYKDQPLEVPYPYLQLLLFPFTFVIARSKEALRANQVKLNMEAQVSAGNNSQLLLELSLNEITIVDHC